MFHILAKHSKLIFGWALVFAFLTLAVSWFLPVEYSAESQVLVISRGPAGIDPYLQSKAAERIAANLGEILKTSDFYEKVVSQASAVFDKNRWQILNERDRRKNWERDVNGSSVYGTGVLKIKVYSFSQKDATALSDAVTHTVVSRGWEYVGGDVAIKVVANPLVSRYPARPNYVLNVILGFVGGALLSGFWVLEYRKHKIFWSL